MSDVMHITADQLIDTLRNEGLRITEARRAVCTVIAESHADHLDAATVYDRARNELGAQIDRSTVYRTLDVLEAAGVIRHAHVGDAAVYHLEEEQRHQHLVCDSCGATVSVPADELVEFAETIRKRTGFQPDVEHFAVSGLCESCAAADSIDR